MDRFKKFKSNQGRQKVYKCFVSLKMKAYNIFIPFSQIHTLVVFIHTGLFNKIRILDLQSNSLKQIMSLNIEYLLVILI